MTESVPCWLVALPDEVESFFMESCRGYVEQVRNTFMQATQLVNEHGDAKLTSAITAGFVKVCKSTHRLESAQCDEHAKSVTLPVGGGTPVQWCKAFWKDYYKVLVTRRGIEVFAKPPKVTKGPHEMPYNMSYSSAGDPILDCPPGHVCSDPPHELTNGETEPHPHPLAL